VPLEGAAYSALSKGLNYAVAPGCIPAKNFLCGVEKAIVTLPEETAEEIRQETVRILKGSLQPKDNLTGAERRALRSLKANDSLTISNYKPYSLLTSFSKIVEKVMFNRLMNYLNKYAIINPSQYGFQKTCPQTMPSMLS
jgi:hypothetical protein